MGRTVLDPGVARRADMSYDTIDEAPLLRRRDYDAPSVFTAGSLLRQARRQKELVEKAVPEVCVLDPDGDFVDHLRDTGRAERHASWACYHTTLHTWLLDGLTVGIIGRVVGAPFATLVAEELFASGCRYLISITSAGQITPAGTPPYMVLIERALRDEGTSHHYRPSSRFTYLDPSLRRAIATSWDHSVVPLQVGSSWTTDALFRETEEEISAHRAEGILAVEMEAAALYALAEAKGFRIQAVDFPPY